MKFNRTIFESIGYLLLLALLVAPPTSEISAQESNKGKSTSAKAEKYTLALGRGTTVCEGYLKLLNSKESAEPPLCTIQLDTHYVNLREPDWEILDLKGNLELIYSVERLLGPAIREKNDLPSTFDAWKVDFDARVRNTGAIPRLRKAKVKLAPSSPEETILSYEQDMRECRRKLEKGSLTRGNDQHLFVFNQKNNSIDLTASLHIRNIGWKILLYDDRALLHWAFVGSDMKELGGHINIYRLRRYETPYEARTYLVSDPLCRFRFEFPEKSQ